MEQWLSITQQTAEQFVDALKEQSTLAVKVDIALRAVALAQKLDATEDDLEMQFERIAAQVKKKPAAIRKAYDKNDAISDLRSQISKSKAIDWLLHNSKFVDDKGNAIDTDTVLGDHNHDALGTGVAVQKATREQECMVKVRALDVAGLKVGQFVRAHNSRDVGERDDLHRIKWVRGGGQRVQGERHGLGLPPGVVDDHGERLVDEQGNRGPGGGLCLVHLKVIGHQRRAAGDHASTHRPPHRAHDIDWLLVAEHPFAAGPGEFACGTGACDGVLPACGCIQ
jgi:hypothetical protein